MKAKFVFGLLTFTYFTLTSSVALAVESVKITNTVKSQNLNLALHSNQVRVESDVNLKQLNKIFLSSKEKENTAQR